MHASASLHAVQVRTWKNDRGEGKLFNLEVCTPARPHARTHTRAHACMDEWMQMCDERDDIRATLVMAYILMAYIM